MISLPLTRSPSALGVMSWRDCGGSPWLCDEVAKQFLGNRSAKCSYTLEVSTTPLKRSKQVYLHLKRIIVRYSFRKWDMTNVIYPRLESALTRSFQVYFNALGSPLRVYVRLVKVKVKS